MKLAVEEEGYHIAAGSSSRWVSAESAGLRTRSMTVYDDRGQTLWTAATGEQGIVPLDSSPGCNLQDYMTGDSTLASHYRMELDGMLDLAIVIASSQMLAGCRKAAVAAGFGLLGIDVGTQTKLDLCFQMNFDLGMGQWDSSEIVPPGD